MGSDEDTRAKTLPLCTNNTILEITSKKKIIVKTARLTHNTNLANCSRRLLAVQIQVELFGLMLKGFHCIMQSTVIPEIFALLIFVR